MHPDFQVLTFWRYYVITIDLSVGNIPVVPISIAWCLCFTACVTVLAISVIVIFCLWKRSRRNQHEHVTDTTTNPTDTVDDTSCTHNPEEKSVVNLGSTPEVLLQGSTCVSNLDAMNTAEGLNPQSEVVILDEARVVNVQGAHAEGVRVDPESSADKSAHQNTQTEVSCSVSDGEINETYDVDLVVPTTSHGLKGMPENNLNKSNCSLDSVDQGTEEGRADCHTDVEANREGINCTPELTSGQLEVNTFNCINTNSVIPPISSFKPKSPFENQNPHGRPHGGAEGMTLNSGGVSVRGAWTSKEDRVIAHKRSKQRSPNQLPDQNRPTTTPTSSQYGKRSSIKHSKVRSAVTGAYHSRKAHRMSKDINGLALPTLVRNKTDVLSAKELAEERRRMEELERLRAGVFMSNGKSPYLVDQTMKKEQLKLPYINVNEADSIV